MSLLYILLIILLIGFLLAKINLWAFNNKKVPAWIRFLLWPISGGETPHPDCPLMVPIEEMTSRTYLKLMTPLWFIKIIWNIIEGIVFIIFCIYFFFGLLGVLVKSAYEDMKLKRKKKEIKCCSC